MNGLRRFWFRFESRGEEHLPLGAAYGVGVTAATADEALTVIRDIVFGGNAPPVTELIEDVDVSTLDEGHVRPNMDAPTEPGIWFPRGYG